MRGKTITKILVVIFCLLFISSPIFAVSENEFNAPITSYKRVGSDLNLFWSNSYPTDTQINISDGVKINTTVVNANGVLLKNVSSKQFNLTTKAIFEELEAESTILIPELVEDKSLPSQESNPFWLLELQKQYYNCQQQMNSLEKKMQQTVITPVTYIYPEQLVEKNAFNQGNPQVSSAVANKPLTDVKGITESQKQADNQQNQSTLDIFIYAILVLLTIWAVIYTLSKKLFSKQN